MFGPLANWLPCTVTVAVAVKPDALRLAVPINDVPRRNDTVPVGALLPLIAQTLAVSTVLAPDERVAGLAETLI
jgi:hypothetical protein